MKYLEDSIEEACGGQRVKSTCSCLVMAVTIGSAIILSTKLATFAPFQYEFIDTTSLKRHRIENRENKTSQIHTIIIRSKGQCDQPKIYS